MEPKEHMDLMDRTKGTSRTHGLGVRKDMAKVMAVRKHAPKKKGKSRKPVNPKDFTTLPPPKKRARSQCVQDPFIEVNTDEVRAKQEA
ncbi:hypothetical protein Bca52824_035485 [Brassica carinata]|uniref:Uncharacterized protein n=1 Tax=Brassica carinata TaxID=52824 RepID=A0A8X7S4B4_BRACI|nr:hypothetical protein Bca52824_035485 [Brassica carinata]